MAAPPSPLRLSRMRAGLRLYEAAQHLGLSISYLSMVERGALQRPEVIKKLRAFYKRRRPLKRSA